MFWFSVLATSCKVHDLVKAYCYYFPAVGWHGGTIG